MSKTLLATASQSRIEAVEKFTMNIPSNKGKDIKFGVAIDEEFLSNVNKGVTGSTLRVGEVIKDLDFVGYITPGARDGGKDSYAINMVCNVEGGQQDKVVGAGALLREWPDGDTGLALMESDRVALKTWLAKNDKYRANSFKNTGDSAVQDYLSTLQKQKAIEVRDTYVGTYTVTNESGTRTFKLRLFAFEFKS